LLFSEFAGWILLPVNYYVLHLPLLKGWQTYDI